MWHSSLAVRAHAMYQYHVYGTDTVGRSVNTRGPIDHNSVGLAQARPNNMEPDYGGGGGGGGRPPLLDHWGGGGGPVVPPPPPGSYSTV